MNAYKRPTLHRSLRVIVLDVLSHWTVPVWLMAIALGVYLYARGSFLSGMSGVVDAMAEPVAPIETARLQSVEVQVGDKVKAGQVIARMDTSLLDAQLVIDESDLTQTEIDISRYQQSVLLIERQFQQSLRDAEAALATLAFERDRDTAEREALSRELKRREELLAKRLIPETDVSDLRPQLAALDQAVTAYPGLIATLEGRVAETRRELDAVGQWLQSGGTSNTAAAIIQRFEDRAKLLAASHQMAQQRRDAYTLKAARDGVVAEVLYLPGVVVPAGMPVARIILESTDRVSGFLPEHHLHGVQIGDRVLVCSRGERPKVLFKAEVESIAPEVATLPNRFSPINAQPLRGRRVILRMLEPNDLLPGETVEVRSEQTLWQRWIAVWRSWSPRKNT